MSNMQVSLEQYKRLPVLLGPDSCSGKVYVVTGSNHGLGLETARHLVQASAARVILAVRNLKAGEEAKADIERTTGRKGVAEVWHLDLGSFESIRAFAQKTLSELDRIDSFIANAGIMLDRFTLAEGTETCMTVNVIGTLALAVLVMPKLQETARKFDIQPRLVFLVSALGFQAQSELAKGGKTNIFDGLNDQKRVNMDQRYALTKLVQIYVVRELAALYPVDRTGVIINMVAPGLCSTGLARDTRTWTRTWIGVLRAMLARTAEQGSRTILHGVVVGKESHGRLLSGCKIKDYWVPEWMTNADGQRMQKQLWKELAAKMEAIQPGCLSSLS